MRKFMTRAALFAGLSTLGCNSASQPTTPDSTQKKQGAAQAEANAPQAEGVKAEAHTKTSQLRSKVFSEVLASFDLDGVRADLDGTWVFTGGVFNVASAWVIEGPSFTFVGPDGVHRAGSLEVVAPCKIAHIVASGGQTITNYHRMVATKDGVFSGGSAIGIRQTQGWVVCTPQGLLVKDDAECWFWRDAGGLRPNWQRETANCQLKTNDDGTTQLRAESKTMGEVTLSVHEELLLQWSPTEMQAHRGLDLDSAIAAVRTANTSNDDDAR